MASKLIFLSSATEELKKLPRNVQIRVAKAIDDLEAFPIRRIGIVKLKPPFDGYRKRVGDYRILFDYADDTVYVQRITDRKDAYR